MIPTSFPADANARQTLADDGRPRFLDEVYDAAADDHADWWLDLGRIDLPA